MRQVGCSKARLKKPDTNIIRDLGGTDRIADFQIGIDKIDFTGSDANGGLAGDQAFTFIGAAAFGHVAGQLRSWRS